MQAKMFDRLLVEHRNFKLPTVSHSVIANYQLSRIPIIFSWKHFFQSFTIGFVKRQTSWTIYFSFRDSGRNRSDYKVYQQATGTMILLVYVRSI